MRGVHSGVSRKMWLAVVAANRAIGAAADDTRDPAAHWPGHATAYRTANHAVADTALVGR